MKLEPKHSALILLVASREKIGTPRCVVQAKSFGAWGSGVVARPYSTRVPAKSAWFPADSTEVRITVFINDAATAV